MNKPIDEWLKGYFAGFLDGEGCIQAELRDNNTSTFVQVTNVDSRPLVLLQHYFNGNITKGGNARDIWIWAASSKNAEFFLQTVGPMCMVKHDQIVKWFELRSGLNKSGKFVTPEEFVRRAKIISEIKAYRKLSIDPQTARALLGITKPPDSKGV